MLEDRSQNGRRTEILRYETDVRSLASQVIFSSFRSQKRLVKHCVLLSDGDSPKNMRREVQQHGEKQPGDGVGNRVKGVQKSGNDFCISDR